MTFDRFVAVDWTGAKGERHAAIALAECSAGDSAPSLVRPGHRWSRLEVFDWVAEIAAHGGRVLVGFDFSFSFPCADIGTFFPGDIDSPADARALWAEVDAAAADDPYLAAHGAIARRRGHYWLGAHDGDKAAKARLRTVERVWAAKRLGAASSVFALLGAAQCGKASLSGMRLLHRWGLPVWPFDPVPDAGPLLVEIYCRTFAADGGVRGKIRDRATLDAALARLGSAPVAALPDTFADHIGDALISAAGMRRAARDVATWTPAGLDAVRATEGWTFGVA
jgi:hypothetical protein